MKKTLLLVIVFVSYMASMESKVELDPVSELLQPYQAPIKPTKQSHVPVSDPFKNIYHQ